MLRLSVVALLLASTLAGCVGSDEPAEAFSEASSGVASGGAPAAAALASLAQQEAGEAAALPEPQVDETAPEATPSEGSSKHRVYGLNVRLKGAGVLEQSFTAPEGLFVIRYAAWTGDVPCVGVVLFTLTSPDGTIEADEWDCQVIVYGPSLPLKGIAGNAYRAAGVYDLDVAFTGAVRPVFTVDVMTDQPFTPPQSSALQRLAGRVSGSVVMEQDFAAGAGTVSSGAILWPKSGACLAVGSYTLINAAGIVRQEFAECSYGWGGGGVRGPAPYQAGAYTARLAVEGTSDFVFSAWGPSPP